MVTRNRLEPSSVLASDGSREKESRRPDFRLILIQFLVVLVFAVLLAQLWRLQIVESNSFRRLADINRFRVSPVESPRGIIYDRNHQILASNKPSFDVAVVPAALPKDDPDKIYEELSRLLGIPAADIADTVKKRRSDDFTPVAVKRDVERDLAMKVEEQHLKLPGVLIVPESSRLYPFAQLTSHILGYMLPITEEQLAEREKNTSMGYRPADRLGAAGVEATYEQELRGKPGKKLYEVDATERPVADIRVDGPDPGHNLTLSLDIELQKDVTRLLQAGMGESLSAVAIVMDPRNGQILSIVSLPSYDNNLFAGVVKPSDLQRLLEDPRKPMIDYSIGGTFPPGSTFKLVTAAGSLQEGVADANTEINCPGALYIPNQYNPALSQRLPCWGVHGKQDFAKGLSNSCDVYYWTLGGGTDKFQGLGNQRLSNYAKLLGYGAPTGIDLPGEVAGLVPNDKWKVDTWGEEWLKGDTYNMSIGQGFVLSTPLQVANATNAIANGGRLLEPRLAMAFSDAEDQPLSTVDSKETRRLDIERQHLELIKKGMQGVLLNDDLKKFNVPELKIAGKTGTAEFPGPKDAKGIMPTHGWFTAFAPYDNPEVSVTVFVQRGGGPSTAAPIAIEIIKRYFRYSGPPVEATPTSQPLPPTQVVAPPTQAPARSTTASAGPTGTPAASTATPSGR